MFIKRDFEFIANIQRKGVLKMKEDQFFEEWKNKMPENERAFLSLTEL